MGSYDRRTVVVIPTYNELENLAPLLARVHTAVPTAHVLIVDDNSPDGTGQLADRLASDDTRVHVMHRTEKQGLGAAYVAGFSWCLDQGFEIVGQMDADGSHQPEQLPALLYALSTADAVIGSRWVPGGDVVNWPRTRKYLSVWGNTYARLMLGIPVRDATGGYRAFRRQVLESIDLDAVDSRGYCFQVDVTRRVVSQGFHLIETPITFVEREYGESKMSRSIVTEALWRVTAWGFRRRLRPRHPRGQLG